MIRDQWTGSSQQCAHFINTIRGILKQEPIPHTGCVRGVKHRRPERTGRMSRRTGDLLLEAGAYGGLPIYGRSGGRSMHDAGAFYEVEPL
jgi:hypothetical protein